LGQSKKTLPSPIGLDYHLSIPQDVRRKYIIAIIDAENTVAESDKENNYVVWPELFPGVFFS